METYKHNLTEIFNTVGYSPLRSPTYCKLKYSSFQVKKTLSFYPYQELANCQHKICDVGEYQCREKNYCIDLINVCDGTIHCHHADDEEFCGKQKIIHI